MQTSEVRRPRPLLSYLPWLSHPLSTVRDAWATSAGVVVPCLLDGVRGHFLWDSRGMAATAAVERDWGCGRAAGHGHLAP